MSKKTSPVLSDYTILAVALPPVVSFPTSATHYMYIRKDAPKVPTADSSRSLFLANVPIDASERCLRAFFKQIGGAILERVDYEEDIVAERTRSNGILVKGQQWQEEQTQHGRKRKREPAGDGRPSATLPAVWSFKARKSGENAVAVFVDKATADAVLSECSVLAKRNQSVPWTPLEELGLARYRAHHKLTFPPRDELEQSVNDYLAQYATLEAARNKKLKQLRTEPDEDGFIVVTRGGRSGPARVEEAQAAAEKLKERGKKRIGATFYRFQTREDAKKRERDLRIKFESDAQKLKDMRQRRGLLRPD